MFHKWNLKMIIQSYAIWLLFFFFKVTFRLWVLFIDILVRFNRIWTFKLRLSNLANKRTCISFSLNIFNKSTLEHVYQRVDKRRWIVPVYNGALLLRWKQQQQHNISSINSSLSFYIDTPNNDMNEHFILSPWRAAFAIGH